MKGRHCHLVRVYIHKCLSLLVCVVGKIYREAWVVDPLLLLVVHLKLVVVHLDLAVLEPSLEALAPMGGEL